MLKISRASFSILLVFILSLPACTPKFDWREVRGANASFVVVLPAKPSSFTRPINLDGQPVTMTMTAAEVDRIMFAVGTASLADPVKAQRALRSMRTALVNNIGGTVKLEKSSDDKIAQTTSIDIEADGPPSANSAGQAIKLFARFVAKDKQVFQVVVIGPEKSVPRDAVDTFFTSFKLN